MTWRDEARKRLDAATPGPWHADGILHIKSDSANVIGVLHDGGQTYESVQANAALIANAPTDLRRLLDLLDECEAWIQAVYPPDPPTPRNVLLAKLREER